MDSLFWHDVGKWYTNSRSVFDWYIISVARKTGNIDREKFGRRCILQDSIIWLLDMGELSKIHERFKAPAAANFRRHNKNSARSFYNFILFAKIGRASCRERV